MYDLSPGAHRSWHEMHCALIAAAGAFSIPNSDRVRDRMKRFFHIPHDLLARRGDQPPSSDRRRYADAIGGGATAIAILTSPTVTPFVSSNFVQIRASATATSSSPKPNGNGTSGAMQLPGRRTAANSATYYFELAGQPRASSTRRRSKFHSLGANLISNTVPGQPNFTPFQRSFCRSAGLAMVRAKYRPTAATGGSVGGGMSNYANGLLSL